MAQRNTFVKWGRFITQKQKSYQSVDTCTFIHDLYRIAKDCNYGTLWDELTRGRIIVGVLDHTLSDHLQTKSDLTVADSIHKSQQTEASKQNRTVVCGDEKPSNVDYANCRPRPSNGKSNRDQTEVPKKTSEIIHFVQNLWGSGRDNLSDGWYSYPILQTINQVAGPHHWRFWAPCWSSKSLQGY